MLWLAVKSEGKLDDWAIVSALWLISTPILSFSKVYDESHKQEV
jgi:hypothetical protein